MALDAKITMLKEMETIMSNEITAADMSRVLTIAADVLQNYSVTSVGEVDDKDSDDMFNAYMSAMKVLGRSPGTLERYRYVIAKLMKDIKVSTRNVTVYHLRDYLAHEQSRGISDRTLEGIRQVFSAYFGWLWREGLIVHNPVANLGAIKCQIKEKEVFSDVEMEKINYGCETLRDRAIIHFLDSTMCRISEMTRLNREDVNIEAMTCIVLGKGNKERQVYFDSVTAMLLKEYLDSRMDNDPALFVGRYGSRIHPNGVRAMMKRLANRAGVEHIHPHKFRRSKITELVKRGMQIEFVKTLAGHEKLDTTMGYVVMDKTTVENAYRKYA